jgi:hypothetical protein
MKMQNTVPTVPTVSRHLPAVAADLSPEWFEELRERAALMQDGGLSLAEADAEALLDILGRINQGEETGGACPCAACDERAV